jgi:hypothetical protein
MHEEADPLGRMDSSSSNHRDAKGGKWISGDTSGLTSHTSSRSEKPAGIEIFHFLRRAVQIPTRCLLEACHLFDATGDLSAFGFSVQVSPRTMLPLMPG